MKCVKLFKDCCEFLILGLDWWGKIFSPRLPQSLPSPLSVFSAYSFIWHNECYEYLLCAWHYSKPCGYVKKQTIYISCCKEFIFWCLSRKITFHWLLLLSSLPFSHLWASNVRSIPMKHPLNMARVSGFNILRNLWKYLWKGALKMWCLIGK